MKDNKGAAHRNIDIYLLNKLKRIGASEANGAGIDWGNVTGYSSEFIFYTAGLLVYIQKK
jgi:hypothetical protein